MIHFSGSYHSREVTVVDRLKLLRVNARSHPLIAQLVEHCTSYRRDHGFKSRSGLNFLWLLFYNCVSYVNNYDDQS